jgi:penicillin-insensitive murein endopeptidase
MLYVQVMKTSKLAPIVCLLLLAGCAKMKSNSPLAPQQETGSVILEKELKPTDNSNAETLPTQGSVDDSEYEPIPTEIKTETGILKLGRTRFSKVNYTYDKATESIRINAHLKMYSADQRIVFENDVELLGYHTKTLGTASLAQKNHSSGAPAVRAKVTCLNTNDQDEFVCDHAIVDFFVLYEKQYFTDQFETLEKSTAESTQPKAEQKNEQPKAEPVKPSEPTTSTEQQPEVDDVSDLQSEGSEESIDSRYQGQVQSTNLEELFSSQITSSDTTKKTAEPTVKPQPTAPITPEDSKKSDQPVKPTPTTPAPVKELKKVEDKIINASIKQTADGKIRPYNQAIGYPNKGTLRNATSLQKQQELSNAGDLFSIAFPQKQRFYATYEMSEMISKLGQFVQKQEKGFTLFVGNISAKNGGHIAPHKSHQIGVDVDIAYPKATAGAETKFPVVVPRSKKVINTQAYSVEKTFELFKFAFKQNEYPVDRIFVDQLIIADLCKYAIEKNELNGPDKDIVSTLFQNIQHVDGHGDHFHLRLKCTESQPGCRSKIYKKSAGCVAKSK